MKIVKKYFLWVAIFWAVVIFFGGSYYLLSSLGVPEDTLLYVLGDGGFALMATVALIIIGKKRKWRPLTIIVLSIVTPIGIGGCIIAFMLFPLWWPTISFFLGFILVSAIVVLVLAYYAKHPEARRRLARAAEREAERAKLRSEIDKLGRDINDLEWEIQKQNKK